MGGGGQEQATCHTQSAAGLKPGQVETKNNGPELVGEVSDREKGAKAEKIEA